MLEHRIVFTPAYDRRDEKPNYGQHPMHIAFIVKGGEGALVFDLNTRWYLDRSESNRPEHVSVWGVVAHAAITHMHANISEARDNCDWLNGETCIAQNLYGLTSNEHTRLLDGFLKEGESWLWAELDKTYSTINWIEIQTRES